MLTGGAGRENASCWSRKGECRLLVLERRLLTAGGGRENAKCWCRKGVCGLPVQEGCYSGKQNGGAGRENADCWCRKKILTAGTGRGNADCWCRKAVAQESRMETQEVRVMTACAGWENAD